MNLKSTSKIEKVAQLHALGENYATFDKPWMNQYNSQLQPLYN